MRKRTIYIKRNIPKRIAAAAGALLFAAAIVFAAVGCENGQKKNDLPALPELQTSGGDESVLSFNPPQQTSSEDASLLSENSATASDASSDLPATPSDPASESPDTTPAGPTDPSGETSGAETSAPPAFQPVSGRFSSDTGTSLNISVDYTVESPEEGVYTVRATVYLDSYTLFCSSRTNCNYLTIGDNEFVFSTEPFVFNEGSGRHHTEIFSSEVVYTAETFPEELYISASWFFHGSYSKIEIDRIVAETTLRVPLA